MLKITWKGCQAISTDKIKSYLVELTEDTRAIKQPLAGLKHEARQPRLATGADVEPDIKTRKRTENAAADRVMGGDISSARSMTARRV